MNPMETWESIRLLKLVQPEVDKISKSYNDKAYTELITVCNLCGKNLDTKTKNHSWYG